MNRLDLIIDALQNCSAFQPKNYYEIDKALAAARELKALAQPEQEPVCDKDPFYCWSISCQVGKVCNHAPSEPPFELTDAGADTNITQGLEPKGSGMVALSEQEPCKCIDQFWCATFDRCKRNE